MLDVDAAAHAEADIAGNAGGDDLLRIHVKAAVLVGSLLAAALAVPLLKRRDVLHRRLFKAENADLDHDGIPDIHQQPAD